MSVFDQSFSKASGCFSICNNQGERQSAIPAMQVRVEDDLKTSADRQKKQQIDDMLSKAMSGLSFDERQEQLEILHGVKPKVIEQEAFIDASLQQLESQLSRIKSGSVYEIAEQMDRTYVKNRAFRTMFLRASRYDIQDSAEKMIKFFEFKSQLFGTEKLVKDITLADMDEGDIAAIKSGVLQVCGKDRCGRIIYGNFVGFRRKSMSLRNELRSRYYIEMSALEDEDIQLGNCVHIVFSVGDMKDRFGGSGFFEMASGSETVPCFMAGLHLCTDEVKEYLIQEVILKAAPLKLRSRSRLHFGSQTVCLYHLSTYGIPKKFLPVNPKTNKVDLKRHLQWVESRFAKENYGRRLPAIMPSKVNSIITNPNDNDVLVGTGKRCYNIGNKRLRAQVKELSEAYENASKDERKELMESVIASVLETGGRFLKEDKDDDWNVVWILMPRIEIRKNVAQAFRNSYKRR